MSVYNRFRDLIGKVTQAAPVKNQQAVLDMVAKTACQSCAALVPDIFNRLLDSLHQASELQAQSGNTSASRQILSIYTLVYENK